MKKLVISETIANSEIPQDHFANSQILAISQISRQLTELFRYQRNSGQNGISSSTFSLLWGLAYHPKPLA